MNRQQKRAELRKLSKDISKAKTGQLTINQVKEMRSRIDKLQAVGVLQKPRKSKLKKISDFFRSFGRKPVGYEQRSR